jgi:hypothetical protein
MSDGRIVADSAAEAESDPDAGDAAADLPAPVPALEQEL